MNKQFKWFLAGLETGTLGAAALHKSLTKRIRTIKTIKNIEGDLYKVDYFADYKLEEVLDENIGSVSDLEKSKKDSGMTPAQAMDLLEEVSIKWTGEWQTEWSVVYHLDDFSLDICNDMNYAKVHHFKD